MTLLEADSGIEMEWWDLIDYDNAMERMNSTHALFVENRLRNKTAEKAVRGNSEINGHSQKDGFFYLEHPPVITFGRATPPDEINCTNHDIPTHSVPRGGLATYHAPGQLVGYIVMDLSRRSGGRAPDIHTYLRALEQGLIDFINDEFNLEATRRQDFTGVWTPAPSDDSHPGRKLASIGVSARKWITSHGFALNIHPDMIGFQSIIPCGITDAKMTSVRMEQERAGLTFVAKPMKEYALLAHKHLVQSLQVEGWLS